jgi:glyoxylase-like metal-dependent hydrolase (beta-lactamase superfamily II)
MSSPLHLEVRVLPYKPIVGLIPPMSDGEPTWPATSVTLISGEHDAVLVDAACTDEDGAQVVDWIRKSGKNLTTIYITRGHRDHFFGLNTILEAFPEAKAGQSDTSPSTIVHIRARPGSIVLSTLGVAQLENNRRRSEGLQ